MAFELNEGRAAFFKQSDRTSAKQPAITGTVVMQRDVVKGEKINIALWDDNENPDYLSGTAR